MSVQYDYLIVGAGPAGLQLGYYLQKADHTYLILEEGPGPGSFFKTFPRHRKLISINKVFTGHNETEVNLRWDWNSLLSDSDDLLFKNYSKEYFPGADDIVRYLEDYAQRFNLHVQYGTRVASIGKTEGGGFQVRSSTGEEFVCRCLVIATGFTKLYLPDLPGIELAEKYTEMSVDPQDFVNQKVLIVGKGNSGFETAENLIGTAAMIHVASPTPIKMAWQTKFVGHLRAVNNNFLDTYQLKVQNAVLDATVKKIERRNGKYAVSLSYTHASGEEEEILYDRVLLCTGWRFDNSIFEESCRPRLVYNDKLPEQTSAWESTNVKDLYFAGTLMQMRDYKKKQSGFIHGFRYNVQTLHRILEQKYHGKELPYVQFNAQPEELVNAIIKRVNRTSALWQQTGFLCDLLVVSDDGHEARYYEELPADYVQDEFGLNEHYYTITLDFGGIQENPFSINRQPDAERAASSSFLHPVIRRFNRGEQISEHHLLENLFGEWLTESVHIQPLLAYFSRELPVQHRAAEEK
jgi:thioredoxin reductase